eukprot:1197403-Rhodomonas_salina.1
MRGLTFPPGDNGFRRNAHVRIVQNGCFCVSGEECVFRDTKAPRFNSTFFDNQTVRGQQQSPCQACLIPG